MSNEITVSKTEIAPLTTAELTENMQVIQRVLSKVMAKGVHYDTIPGCGNKPVLLKPGAEKILATFRIGVDTTAEDIGAEGEIRYKVTCRGFYIPTGDTVGYGVGEASTAEKKYKWREAVCQEEWDLTPENRRQILFKRQGGGKVSKVLQVRTDPADSANTVLKMAKKRAMVDLCLTATACSDLFTQDLEDDQPSAPIPQKPRYQQPRPLETRAVAPNPAPAPAADSDRITVDQQRQLYTIGQSKGLTTEEMSWLVFNVAGVNSAKEVGELDFYDLKKAFEAAEAGKVIK